MQELPTVNVNANDFSFTVQVDFDQKLMVWHCDVRRWSVAVAKEMLSTLHEIAGDYPEFDHLAPYVNKQQAKFMSLMGFEATDLLSRNSAGQPVSLWRLHRGN